MYSEALIFRLVDVVGQRAKQQSHKRDEAPYSKSPVHDGHRTIRTEINGLITVGRLGTLVCWDQWYPEGARLTALQGAVALFYPTAIGWHPAEKAEFGVAQHDAWRTIQRSHAIANGGYVAVVNRVGFETGNVRGKSAPGQGLEFWGASFFCDPFGRVLAEASHDREEILVGEVDLKALEEIRRNWPFLRDRRIDAYAPITNRLLDER